MKICFERAAKAIVLAGFLLSGRAGAECQMTKFGSLAIQVQDNRIVVPGQINGHPMKFLFDPAAPGTLLLAPYAHSVGLNVDDLFANRRSSSLESRSPMGQATLDEMRVDSYSLKGIRVTVRGQHETFGQPDLVALLGNDFLGQFDIEIDLKANTLNLFKPQGCEGANLAYWTDAYNVLDLDPSRQKVQMTVKVNGNNVAAVMDGGSPFSGLTDLEATSANISTDAAPLESPAGTAGASDYFTVAYDVANGFGAEHRGINTAKSGPEEANGGPSRVWLASADSVQLDQETIHPAKLRVFRYAHKSAEIGSRMGGQAAFAEGMVLGVDFLRSHHVLISHSQNKFYFSYSGGAPFQMAQ